MAYKQWLQENGDVVDAQPAVVPPPGLATPPPALPGAAVRPAGAANANGAVGAEQTPVTMNDVQDQLTHLSIQQENMQEKLKELDENVKEVLFRLRESVMAEATHCPGRLAPMVSSNSSMEAAAAAAAAAE